MKPKSKSELAAEYGITRKTLATWLKKIGVEVGKQKILSSVQLETIYKHLGKP